MKNSIKRLALLSIIISIIYSCDSNKSDIHSKLVVPNNVKATNIESNQIKAKFDKFRKKRHYNDIVRPYLILSEEGGYILDITQEEAEKIGIPKEIYDLMVNEIKETNDKIKELRSKGIEVETPDPRNQDYRKEIQNHIETRSYVDSLPEHLSGRLVASGQERVTTGFVWAPYTISKVLFKCQAAAALTPMFTCATYSSGGWIQRTKVGGLGFAEILVPLYVSNDYVVLSFQTTDSNGGYAVYYGV